MEENKELVQEQTEVVSQQPETPSEPKKRKGKKKKSVVARIFDFIISVIVFGILAAWLYDFYNFYTQKEPQLCIKEETIKYEDGTTEVCTGLGYKVYQYKRESIQGIEFGTFWLEERK